MNAISIATNMIQLTANSKAALLVAVLAFGALCVYRMVTGGDWLAKLLGVLLLVAAVVALGGCVPADPMRSAQAIERTNASAVTMNQSAAQISQAQQADDEARKAQERLLTLQTQQAIVQGQQAIAEANARQGIAESDNAALVQIADQIAQASKPDNTVLIVLLVCSFGLAGVVIWKLFAANTQLAQALPMPAAVQRELPAPNYIQIPAAVQRHADQRGGVALFDYDGDRWLIVDRFDYGRVLATQRKQLTSREG